MMEHLIASLRFDARMSHFTRVGVRIGCWRVASCAPCSEPTTIFVDHPPTGEPVLKMPVARRLKGGQVCSPVKLALEYNRRRAAEDTTNKEPNG